MSHWFWFNFQIYTFLHVSVFHFFFFHVLGDQVACFGLSRQLYIHHVSLTSHLYHAIWFFACKSYLALTCITLCSVADFAHTCIILSFYACCPHLHALVSYFGLTCITLCSHLPKVVCFCQFALTCFILLCMRLHLHSLVAHFALTCISLCAYVI